MTEDIVHCTQCAGDGAYMGTLGNLDWYRCAWCGWEFGQEHRNEEIKPTEGGE